MMGLYYIIIIIIIIIKQHQHLFIFDMIKLRRVHDLFGIYSIQIVIQKTNFQLNPETRAPYISEFILFCFSNFNTLLFHLIDLIVATRFMLDR